MLRRTVERAGGRLLDLHDVVPDDAFKDFLGHMARPGAQAVADRLGPIVLSMANEPTPVAVVR